MIATNIVSRAPSSRPRRALLVEVVVDTVGVGHDVASIVRQERVDGRTVVASRIAVEHVSLGDANDASEVPVELTLGADADLVRGLSNERAVSEQLPSRPAWSPWPARLNRPSIWRSSCLRVRCSGSSERGRLVR